VEYHDVSSFAILVFQDMDPWQLLP
jgi:hypothetical protein